MLIEIDDIYWSIDAIYRAFFVVKKFYVENIFDLIIS